MQSVKDIAFSFATMAVVVIVTIISVPLFLAQIGAERYGALAIAWLVLGYAGQADFGMSRAITQRVAALRGADGDAGQAARAIWSALLVASAIGAIAALVVFVVVDWFFGGPFKIDPEIAHEFTYVALLLALSTPLVNIYSVAVGALLGAERVQLVSTFHLSSSLCLTLFPLAAAYLVAVDLSTLVFAAFLARLAVTAPALAACWRQFLRHQPTRSSRAEIGNLARFGSWVMVTGLISPLLVISDRFLIGAILGAVAVAVYTIPFQVANRTMMIPYAVMQVMFPKLVRGTDTGSHANAREYMVVLGSVYAVVVIGVISLAEPLLRLWLGAELDERSILIAQVIMVGLWANAVAQVPFGFIQARGDPKFTGLLHVAELPIYFAVLVLLGSAFGLAGVAAAFVVRCAGDLLALLYRAKMLDRWVAARLVPTALVVLATLAAIRMWDHAFAPYVIAAAFGAPATIWAWACLPAALRQQLLSRLPMRTA